MSREVTKPCTTRDYRCRHVELLRSLADRLEAIGGPEAAFALAELSDALKTHLDTVDLAIALVLALENTPTSH